VLPSKVMVVDWLRTAVEAVYVVWMLLAPSKATLVGLKLPTNDEKNRTWAGVARAGVAVIVEVPAQTRLFGEAVRLKAALAGVGVEVATGVKVGVGVEGTGVLVSVG
jgi:hypothetical protein